MKPLKHQLLNKLTMTSLWLALGAVVLSCSHGPVVQDFADTANPTVEVTRVNNEIKNARLSQIDVLAPDSFKDAVDYADSASRGLEKQNPAKEVLHSVAQADASLRRASEVSVMAHSNIEDVIVARQAALQAKGPELWAKEFRSTDQDLISATSDLEKNDSSTVIRNRAKLQAAYLDIELKSIKHSVLAAPRETIRLAMQEGAPQFAPRSLAIAQKSVDDTDAYLNANRHEAVELNRRGSEAIALADHALKITRAAKLTKTVAPEETALLTEQDKTKIGTQASELSQSEKRVAGLGKENDTLEQKQKFERMFEAARSEFTASEAEVYKQGNNLMIRLRGLEFPSAQAVLKGSNFPLLAKVQKVIRDFGKSSVIVEGHTDSVGGKTLNEKLSTDRAAAVKEYFNSNAGAEIMDIKSVGYDYQKPIATNKTAAGRAQNRRVDILIQAEPANTNSDMGTL